MSYGIIRAWKSASKYERVEGFLQAIIETNKKYLSENCSPGIEFVDVMSNCELKGIEALVPHSLAKWNLAKDSFSISKIQLSYTEKYEVASFVLNTNNRSTIGLLLISESNGLISHCKIALNYKS